MEKKYLFFYNRYNLNFAGTPSESLSNIKFAEVKVGFYPPVWSIIKIFRHQDYRIFRKRQKIPINKNCWCQFRVMKILKCDF